MTALWQQPSFPWAVGIAVALPAVLIALTELLAGLIKRGLPAAKPVRLLRNYVLPAGALLGVLVIAHQHADDWTWVRVVGTILGFLVILLILSAFNVALFAHADESSWRGRIPSIFVSLTRFALIVIGLAILFSWVWEADVGGLIAALGVSSIVIGLALQNAVGSVISGLLLLFEQPFKLGDWLDTGAVRGRVTEVNWRAVHIDTGNGVQIVPNASLAASSFTNLTHTSQHAHVVEVTAAFSPADSPDEVMAVLRTTATDLPLLAANASPSVSYLGSGKYRVSLPVASPSQAAEASAMLQSWLWYAARRHNLALDEQPPTAPPLERTRAALETLAPVLHGPWTEDPALIAGMTVEEFGACETIQRAGIIADAMRFIVTGSARRTFPGTPNAAFMVARAGDFIGDTTLTRAPEDYTTIAAETTTVLRIDSATIDAIVRDSPTIADYIGRGQRQTREILNEAFPDRTTHQVPASHDPTQHER